MPTDGDAGPAGWLRREWPVLLLALASFVAALAIRRWLVPLGTGNADEGGYAYQAEVFRSGRLTLPAAPHLPFFRPWLTGEHDGQLFFQYQPVWPLLLAASDAVLGAKHVVAAASSAGLVLAVHALARETLGSRRTAAVAAVLVACSPIFAIHSALYLSYLFTTLLATLALTSGLRAARLGSVRAAAASGALLGLLLLTRPFDAVLTATVVAIAVAWTAHRRRRPLLRLAVAATAAALPFVVLALVYNLRTTGSPLVFPASASDPRNRFGFGRRGMQVGEPDFLYRFRNASAGLGLNLLAVIGWTLGGLVTVAAGGWAALQRDRRASRSVLAGFGLLFPLAYLPWWGTSLSAAAAANGLGPIYYVPAFVPLCILGADGLVRLSARQRFAGPTLAVLVVASTAYHLPDKLTANDRVTDTFTEVDRAIPRDGDDALVFVRSDVAVPYTSKQFPFLRNPPGLDGRLLFPIDRGGANGRLLEAMPERRAYLLHRQLADPGDPASTAWVSTPLSAVSGPTVTLRIRVRPPDRGAGWVVVASAGGNPVSAALPEGDRAGAEEVELALALGLGEQPPPVGGTLWLPLADGTEQVVVSVQRPGEARRWERRYDVAVADGAITALRPGTGFFVDPGLGPQPAAADVAAVVDDAG